MGSLHMSEHAPGRSTRRIGFLGAGRMATALARGLLASGFAEREQIVASDPDAAARANFEEEVGVAPTASNLAVAAGAEVLILAVKPQSMASLCDELRPALQASHLVVSIAAGITLDWLSRSLGSTARVVRVMPNTPCLVGRGASGFSVGGTATTADAQFVQDLLETVGVAVQVPEPLLDAVTGLSGSGPAYAFQIIEALSDGGVRAGLPRDTATRLAAQTLLGAAEMVLTTGRHPAALKDAVASPGGTTIAGLHELERGGVRAALMNAVLAATLRSQELGRT